MSSEAIYSTALATDLQTTDCSPQTIDYCVTTVWIEIRVEFAQGPFLAGLPSGSAFLLSCRGALPLPLWQTRGGLARERPQIVCVAREIRTLLWIPKTVSILGTYFSSMVTELSTTNRGTGPELARHWLGTASEICFYTSLQHLFERPVPVYCALN